MSTAAERFSARGQCWYSGKPTKLGLECGCRISSGGNKMLREDI